MFRLNAPMSQYGVRPIITILLKNPLAKDLFYVDRCGVTDDFSLWLGFAVIGSTLPPYAGLILPISISKANRLNSRFTLQAAPIK
jgi:hypothetical protein